MRNTLVLISSIPEQKVIADKARQIGYWPMCVDGGPDMLELSKAQRWHNDMYVKTHLTNVLEREGPAKHKLMLLESLDQAPTTHTLCLMPVNRVYTQPVCPLQPLYKLAFWLRIATSWICDTTHKMVCYPGNSDTQLFSDRTSHLSELESTLTRIKAILHDLDANEWRLDKSSLTEQQTRTLLKNVVDIAYDCHVELDKRERFERCPRTQHQYDANGHLKIAETKRCVESIFRVIYQ